MADKFKYEVKAKQNRLMCNSHNLQQAKYA